MKKRNKLQVRPIRKEIVEIVEMNPVHSRINNPGVIQDLLSYEHEWWRQTQFKKKREVTTVYLTDKKGVYYAGFTSRVLKHLAHKGLEYSMTRNNPNVWVQEYKEPKLDGIDFKAWDQDEPLVQMLSRGRGVWKAPTGAGKTVLIAGLISAYYKSTCLVIVPTQGIFHQTIKTLEKYFSPVGRMGAGEKVIEDVTVAISDTINAMDDEELYQFGIHWGVLIVDEAHRVSKFKGKYERILQNIMAPVRLGLTATPRSQRVSQLAVEGLLGPLIGFTDEKPLEAKGILSKVNIRVLKIPRSQNIKEMKGYERVYEWGVINYKIRNQLILEEVLKLIKDSGTALVFTVKIRHSLILRDLFAKEIGPENVRLIVGGSPSVLKQEISVLVRERSKHTGKLEKLREKMGGLDSIPPSVQTRKMSGEYQKNYVSLINVCKVYDDSIDRLRNQEQYYREVSKEREQYRLDLNEGKYKVAISTMAWREGVDIPNLQVVVNATALKSETLTEQLMGRGRRGTEEKKEFTLVDCFDSTHTFLIDAFGERMSLYSDRGWL